MHAIGVRNKTLRLKPHYKYYVPAVFCKLIGGLGICLVYTYYYSIGGDTTNYFLTARTFVNVLLEGDFSMFWDMLNFRSNNIYQAGYYIYEDTGIYFNSSDYYALFTVVLTIPFCLLGGKSFIATTFLLAYFSFSGLWRLYEVFVNQFPTQTKQFAIALFSIPSVFFWGSGLLKDTFSLSAIGYFTYGIFKFFIEKNRKAKYIILIIFAALLLIYIKPYIFFALLPGSLIWIFFDKLKSITNPIIKIVILPLFITLTIGTIFISMQYLSSYLGDYSLDKVLDKAVKTQQDLIRDEQYGGNSYDIGKFEPTIAGITSKIPAAINLALFRPYIWDARNPVMILSGLENLLILGFTLYIIIKVGILTFLTSLTKHPLLIFSLLFALFFAFSVGLTTANYGALVRLKIPCIPFYVSSLYMLYYLNKERFIRR